MITIDLSQNQVALVDETDWYDLSGENWHAAWNEPTKSFYARLSVTHEQMHRRIMELKRDDSRQIDHINHDTLDNRRENLRIVTHRQNSENRRDQSEYGPGVQKRKSGRFQAKAQVTGTVFCLGTFDTPEEAQQERMNFLREVKDDHTQTNASTSTETRNLQSIETRRHDQRQNRRSRET